MSSYEFFDDYESVSPEIELESFCLFEELQNYLNNAIKVQRNPAVVNCAQVVMRNEYPNNDIETTECTVAAAYNPTKDITAIIYEQKALVDGDPKRAYTLEFYKGAPFGHVFDTENPYQFQVPEIQQPEIMATPLQAAHAIWDMDTESFVVIAHDPPYSYMESDTSVEDYISMRTWLRGADVPLDVV
jgi:hypothetical protein